MFVCESNIVPYAPETDNSFTYISNVLYKVISSAESVPEEIFDVITSTTSENIGKFSGEREFTSVYFVIPFFDKFLQGQF